MIQAGMSTVLAKGISLYHITFPYISKHFLLFISYFNIYSICSYFSAAAAINATTIPMVDETTRLKKARLAGLDARGKPTEPNFLKKHTEPISEGSTEVPAASGSFQPA